MINAITTIELRGYIREYRDKFDDLTTLQLIPRTEKVGYVIYAVPVQAHTGAIRWDHAMGLLKLTADYNVVELSTLLRGYKSTIKKHWRVGDAK